MELDKLYILARWRIWDGHRAFWSVFLSVALTLVVAALLIRGSAEDPARNHIESHKALLALKPPTIPDAQNAALEYQKAFRAFVRPLRGVDDPTSNLNREGAYFETPGVKSFLTANAAALDFIEAATRMKMSNWNLDYAAGLTMQSPHYSPLRQCARLLSLRARVEAHAGNHGAGADDLLRINALAKHLYGDRTLLTELVAISIRSIADSTLQSIVIHDCPLLESDIEHYRDAMKDDFDPLSEFLRVFEGEFVFDAEMLDRVAMEGKMPDDYYNNEIAPLGLFCQFFYGSEHKTQRAISEEILKFAHERKFVPFDDDEFLRRHQKGPSFMTMSMMPAFGRAQTAFARSADSRRCADAALAALAFRAKNARDPRSMNELVPHFFISLPKDVYTQKYLVLLKDNAEIALRHRSVGREIDFCLMPGALRIYSLGRSCRDQRGRNSWSIEQFEGKFKPEYDNSVFFVPSMQEIVGRTTHRAERANEK